jgi:uncharacterized protein (TIGR00369 family)
LKGLQIRFRLEGEEVRAEFVADIFRCGYHGVVHGGVLSALLDETMGWAPAYQKRLFCYAAELRSRFLKPAPLGVKLTVCGRMTADRGRIWETEGEVRDDEGTVYARAWGKYVPMTPEQTLEVIDYLKFGEDTVSRSEISPVTEP